MLFKLSDGKLVLRVMVDDEGYVMLNSRCPVSCGACCGFWRDVIDLKPVSEKKPEARFCPNLRSTGCYLKRPHRPLECRGYVCELGMLTLEKKVSWEQIEMVVREGKQEAAASFLGVPIGAEEGSVSRLRFRERDIWEIRKLFRKRGVYHGDKRVREVREAKRELRVPGGSGNPADNECLRRHPAIIGWRDGWPFF